MWGSGRARGCRRAPASSQRSVWACVLLLVGQVARRRVPPRMRCALAGLARQRGGRRWAARRERRGPWCGADPVPGLGGEGKVCWDDGLELERSAVEGALPDEVLAGFIGGVGGRDSA